MIIRTDASTQMGSGHLMRCLALAQACKDAGGEASFITTSQNEDLLQRIRTEGFKVYILASSHPDPIDWNSTREILAAHSDAWVVLDGYHFDEDYQQWVKEIGQKLLVIDDMAHLKHYYADIVLNQNLHAEQLNYSSEPYTCLLLGTRYVLLRREFFALCGQRRKTPEVAHRILVTLGGGDPENHTFKVIQALQRVDIPDMEVITIIGANNPHADMLGAAVEKSCIPIRLIYNAINMPELMAWADMAISSAGITTWELLYLGVPSLLFTLADNQNSIADEIDKLEIGKVIGKPKDVSVQLLAGSINLLAKDFTFRMKASRNMRKIVDGQGASRVLEILERIKHSIDKDTRKGSNINSLIEREEGLRTIFLGSKQAGCIGLLTLAAAGCSMQAVITYDIYLQEIAMMLKIPTFVSVRQPEIKQLLAQSDLLVTVHGREIVPKNLLELPRLGGINVHPCLYRYKGANPIGRLLENGCTRASVGVHRLTENVDEGEVLVEEFIDINGKYSIEEVYNILYPLYSTALLKALSRVLRR